MDPIERLDISLLYVEDENETRELIADFLLPRVKKLDQAKDGKEGLELYKTNKHDVIVTDIKMPVMNGFEMSRAIKLINKEIPIIITTAYNDTELLIESIEIGVRQFILKPIITAKLFESIKKCAESLKK